MNAEPSGVVNDVELPTPDSQSESTATDLSAPSSDDIGDRLALLEQSPRPGAASIVGLTVTSTFRAGTVDGGLVDLESTGLRPHDGSEPLPPGSFDSIFAVAADQLLVAICCEPAAGALGLAEIEASSANVVRLAQNIDEAAVNRNTSQLVQSSSYQIQTSPLDPVLTASFVEVQSRIDVDSTGFAPQVEWLDDSRFVYEHRGELHVVEATQELFSCAITGRAIEIAKVARDLVVVITEIDGASVVELVSVHPDQCARSVVDLGVKGLVSVDLAHGWGLGVDRANQGWLIDLTGSIQPTALGVGLVDLVWMPATSGSGD